MYISVIIYLHDKPSSYNHATFNKW